MTHFQNENHTINFSSKSIFSPQKVSGLISKLFLCLLCHARLVTVSSKEEVKCNNN